MLIGPATDSDIMGDLAAAIDLANAWARESRVQECTEVCGLALRDLIDRLWARHSEVESKLRQHVHCLSMEIRRWQEGSTLVALRRIQMEKDRKP